jgi:hypothetical protein
MVKVITKLDFGVSERLDCRLRFFNRVEVHDGVGMITSSSVCLADVFDLVFVRLWEHVLDFFHGGRSNPDLSSWSTPPASVGRCCSGGGFNIRDRWGTPIVGGWGRRRRRFDCRRGDNVFGGRRGGDFFAGSDGWEGNLGGVLFDGLTSDRFHPAFSTAIIKVEAYKIKHVFFRGYLRSVVLKRLDRL